MLGQNHRVRLHLLDDLSETRGLAELRCQLIEAAGPTLEGVVSTSNYGQACQGIYFAILIAHFGRRTPRSRVKAMEKKFGIYREIAQSLGAHAHPECKVLLVSHPASLGAVIFQQFAPQIPLANITSLTRADHDRAVGLIAEMLNVARERVRNLIMWGINSYVQHADINHAVVDNLVGPPDAVCIRLNDDAWIMNELRRNIREHGYDIDGDPTRAPYYANSAMGICSHIHDWWVGTALETWVSVGMISNGAYGVPNNSLGSFPATCQDSVWAIQEGLPIMDFMNESVIEARANSHAFHLEAMATMARAHQDGW